MKTATAKVIELANQLVIKHAKKDKKNTRCTCEQDSCKLMGSHSPGRCRNHSTGKGSMYLGPICDECAQFLDTQYIIDIVD